MKLIQLFNTNIQCLFGHKWNKQFWLCSQCGILMPWKKFIEIGNNRELVEDLSTAQATTFLGQLIENLRAEAMMTFKVNNPEKNA